ncbi:MFS general substrate transporter [Teratosphaeria nubilosa]|uniref:MFS general substrate transporter n=1 Tax=Teratosphaeria nubilosa TaxID=161662 RepID=A0A6G1L1T8_9PEZI|nr:MFS general substrate transporter [Teratosphaeria nubilosa]
MEQSPGLERETGRQASTANGVVERPGGATRMAAMRLVLGKHGLKFMWFGIIMILTAYQFDNALIYNYATYATSSFDKVAAISTLGVAGNIVFAVLKPMIAKLSNVIGRGEVYCIALTCYLLSYILRASCTTFNTYAGGTIFASVGMTTANMMNDVVISDISSMRWRGFALSASFIPFFITPWISGVIVAKVVAPDGIGWRWGIGMFAIIMPFAASFIIGALLYYQRKAKKAGLVLTERMTIYEFCSHLDLGGSILLAAGWAMFLLPFSLAATTPRKWTTGWVIALIVLGVVVLIGLVFYEALAARHPILPARYLKSISIVLACVTAGLDNFGFQATHTYLYTWAVVVHGMGPKTATYLTYTNGVTQAVVGLIGGAIMYKVKGYKWLLVAGATIKMIGYGVMIRLRGANNTWAEVFTVQAIQGIGSGLLEIIIIVAAQVAVPHAEMPQVTALVLLFSFIGAAIGTSVAGGIYTGTFKEALRHRLGDLATPSLVNSVYDSITKGIPATGTAQKADVNLAYSDVLRYITYTAVATSALVLLLTLFFPNIRLPETIDPFASNKESTVGTNASVKSFAKDETVAKVHSHDDIG